MAFSLPPLPYSTNALAGQGMCQETLELHHGKHHNAYVTALNGLIESKGLAGKTVGSRVLLVIPKDRAYGDAGQGEAKGDLVFVVDILGAK